MGRYNLIFNPKRVKRVILRELIKTLTDSDGSPINNSSLGIDVEFSYLSSKIRPQKLIRFPH
jgi:hypothetical protein